MSNFDFSKVLESASKFLAQINSRARLWGAFMILVAIVFLAVVFSDKIAFNKWYAFLVFIVFIIIAAGIVIDFLFPARSGQLKEILKLEKSISGIWGEFMHNHPYIGLSVVTIKFNSNRLQFLLEGDAYSKEGEKVAYWRSDASAVCQIDPPEIHYFWSGKVNKPEMIHKSGIGQIKFYSPETGGLCTKATGSYTSENMEKLKITGIYDIDLIRFSPEEQAKLKLSKEELKAFIVNKLKEWKE